MARPRRQSETKFDPGSTVATRMNRPGERLRFYSELNKATGKPRWQHMEPGRMLEILQGIVSASRYSRNADAARKIIQQIRENSPNAVLKSGG